MPWSNQNGGGGPWGGGGDNNNNNNGGPWGQGPKGPKGGGPNTPPDLEDIIRKGQDRLKKVFPGSGGGGASAGSSKPLFFLAGAAIIGFWLFQSIYTVQPDELAIEMRFGKPKDIVSEQGLHFHFWPIETYEKAQIVEKQINIGEQGNRGASQGLMLTGDQNIVNVQFSVLYRVSDPRSYLFNIDNPDETLRQVSESAMREVVGRRPAQDVFRDNRVVIQQEVRSIIQQTLDTYKAGIQINSVSIEDAAPPAAVADAFDEVQRAEQDENRFVQEANQYSNQELGQARGQAAQIREDAAAYKNRIVQEAQGEAERFSSVLGQYQKAPEVTRNRLFLETMEQVLKNTKKIIVEPEKGVVPYLPLNELTRSQQPRTGATNAPATGAANSGGNQ